MPEVVSVSVSTPRRVVIDGMELESSIVREPSAGPIQIESGGPVGNRTAVHPEAVYVFIAEHYDYWAARFGVDRAEWRYGHWGENITLAGVHETQLRIGDIVEIGDSFVGEISSPRNPCLKLAWRLGQPVSALKTLIEAGLMGFYLRVLMPGLVKAGDPVRVRSPHPQNLTVAEVPRLIHDANADPERLRAALAMPGLSDYPAQFLRSRLNQVTDMQWARQGRWAGWRDFRIARVRDESADVRSFDLEPIDGEPVAAFRAGQFLTFRLDHIADAPVQRSWSISAYDTDRTRYRISVKREASGHASRWMHEQVQPGAVLSARAPAGAFVLDRSSLAPVLLVSAGIGVTPLLAMLKAHLERPEGTAPTLLWVHCTRNSATHAFKDEVEMLIGGRSDVVRQIYYSQPLPDDRAGVDYDRDGRLTVDALTSLVARLPLKIGGRSIEIPGQIAAYYICGPTSFQAALRDGLAAWGVEEHSIHTESFAALPASDVGTLGVDGAEVVFARSGISARWYRDEDLTLLELAEAHGLAPESSCRMGHCHSCVCRLEEGQPDYRLVVEGVAPGQVLPCCSVPGSRRVVLDL